jgi:phosphohistidine phosphatase SixA
MIKLTRIHAFLIASAFIASVSANSDFSNSAPYSIIVRTPSATLGIDAIRPANSAGRCDLERQLDEQGLQEIQSLQSQLEHFSVISNIFSSEYCRSREAAAQVFPKNKAKALPMLNDACFAGSAFNQTNLLTTKQWLADADENQIVFMHNCNIRMLFHAELKTQCSGIGRLESGQWMAIKPTNSGFQILQCPAD